MTRASLAAYRARTKAIVDHSSDRGTMVDTDDSAQEAQSSNPARAVSPPLSSGSLMPASLPAGVDLTSTDIEKDIFIEVYFKCFHRYHPCVLPASRLQEYYKDPSFHDQLLPVVTVIRLIGSIYARSSITETLMELTDVTISGALEDKPRGPFLSQALLLYSISSFWSQDDNRSRQQMDLALETALLLGMNRRDFATDLAPYDPVLQECFRRTWWQIYIVDAAYAAIKRSPTFHANSVLSDVDLPCSEDEYESGVRYLFLCQSIPVQS